MARKKCPIVAMKKVSQLYEDIHKLKEIINKAVDDKYEGYFVDYNIADGMVMVCPDAYNTPIDYNILDILLGDATSVEKGIEYIKRNATT